jgi:hypothetical protein
MACHHANALPVKKGSEYSSWVASDPHRKAFEVLLEQRSLDIQNILIQGGLAPAGQKACQNPVCLKCHSLGANGHVGTDPRRQSVLLSEGVTCEACHGPAEKWKAIHFNPSLWGEALSADQKQALGFRNTKDLLVRAWLCTECHVGAPGQEVDHDLIAAGHPVLKFEFSAYHANYPKHWVEKAAGPDFEARLWAVGQVVSAEASLRLLAHRAGPKKGPWPEFAEYDCFACHHELRPKSFRQSSNYLGKGRRPGSIPWSTWYRWGVEESPLREPMKLTAGNEALTDLAKLMARSAPERTQVAQKARVAVEALEKLAPSVAAARYPTPMLEELARVLEPQLKKARSWDEATQTWLALAALHRAVGDDPHRAIGLKEFRKRLTFPKDIDSPRDFVPPALTRPGNPGK